MKINKQTYLNKEQALIVKAIAIIIMLIHHFFTFPNFYFEGVSYDYLANFAKYFRSPTKICVALFAFLTGWAYFYNKNKTIKYSVNKIIRFLINYWLVCIPFLILAYNLGVFNGELKTTLLELFGISELVMIFCWYVYFYIISMLILPFITKCLNKNLTIGLLVGCVLPILLGTIIVKMGGSNFIFKVIALLRQFFPCIAMGYLFAKYELFEYVEEGLKKFKLNNYVVLILIILIALIGRYFVSVLDLIYAPMIIFSIIKLSDTIILNNKFIIFIGKQATNIWFLHCAFFSALGTVLQPIAYLPKNPILVIIWVLCLCSIISVLINKCLIVIYKKLNL